MRPPRSPAPRSAEAGDRHRLSPATRLRTACRNWPARGTGDYRPALTRSAGQRIGHGLLGLVGVWSLVAALVPAGTAQTWLVFADAVSLGVLALADLTAHEVTTENVVHRLEVTTTPASEHSGRAVV